VKIKVVKTQKGPHLKLKESSEVIHVRLVVDDFEKVSPERI
jgi:hypothetical protein